MKKLKLENGDNLKLHTFDFSHVDGIPEHAGVVIVTDKEDNVFTVTMTADIRARLYRIIKGDVGTYFKKKYKASKTNAPDYDKLLEIKYVVNPNQRTRDYYFKYLVEKAYTTGGNRKASNNRHEAPYGYSLHVYVYKPTGDYHVSITGRHTKPMTGRAYVRQLNMYRTARHQISNQRKRRFVEKHGPFKNIDLFEVIEIDKFKSKVKALSAAKEVVKTRGKELVLTRGYW